MQIIHGLNNDHKQNLRSSWEQSLFLRKCYSIKVKMKSKAVSDDQAESLSPYFNGHHGKSMRRFPYLNQTFIILSASWSVISYS